MCYICSNKTLYFGISVKEMNITFIKYYFERVMYGAGSWLLFRQKNI